MTWIRFLQLLIFNCLWLSIANAEERIAVLEFQGTKADKEVLIQLSDEARGGTLAAFPFHRSQFSVITRENLDAILKSQGKDRSCVDESCALSLGKSIGATYILTGNLNRVENQYFLTLSIYSTKTKNLLK